MDLSLPSPPLRPANQPKTKASDAELDSELLQLGWTDKAQVWEGVRGKGHWTSDGSRGVQPREEQTQQGWLLTLQKDGRRPASCLASGNVYPKTAAPTQFQNC